MPGKSAGLCKTKVFLLNIFVKYDFINKIYLYLINNTKNNYNITKPRHNARNTVGG